MIKITNLEKIYRTEEVETVALNKLSFVVNDWLLAIFKMIPFFTSFSEATTRQDLPVYFPNKLAISALTSVEIECGKSSSIDELVWENILVLLKATERVRNIIRYMAKESSTKNIRQNLNSLY